MKDLFVNNAEDRFIELEDIFQQQHASGNAIKIKETSVDLENEILRATARDVWLRYKSASNTSSIEVILNTDDNITNQSMDIIKENSDWKWIRINSEDSKLEDSFKISVTGDIILDKILLTSRTVTEISNRKEVLVSTSTIN